MPTVNNVADWLAPPPLKGPLNRYRILSPTASIRVSPLCLGAMNFGESWKVFMGGCDQKTTEGILDYFYEQGGNFIDTANNYQSEESETWIGEWMKKRGNRDQMVIATKYTTCFRAGHGDQEILTNFAGNGTKSLHLSVDASLKKLQTSYIDILYLHWWDYSTSIPEVMRALHNMVQSGKVLYLGVSDTPAWVVSKANEYARQQGLTPFVVYQGRWGADHRDFERDIIPMAVDEGMALAPWGSIGRGQFKTDAEREKSAGEGRQMGPPSEAAINTSRVLEKLATPRGVGLTTIALAYVLHKAPYTFPIIGGRTIEHLKGNIEALTVSLSEEEIAEIDAANAFDIGFPQSMLSSKKSLIQTSNDVFLLSQAGYGDYVEKPKPIPHHPKDKA